jgi:hypothetical protein
MNHARSVETQAQQVLVSAVQSEASATGQGTQARAREAVNLAHAHVGEVESRASHVIHQMHLKHQAESAELQAVANDANHASQQRIGQLLSQLSHENELLDDQRREQHELQSVIRAWQEEVTKLRKSSEIQRQSQYVVELRLTIHEFKRDSHQTVKSCKIVCSNCTTTCPRPDV